MTKVKMTVGEKVKALQEMIRALEEKEKVKLKAKEEKVKNAIYSAFVKHLKEDKTSFNKIEKHLKESEISEVKKVLLNLHTLDL